MRTKLLQKLHICKSAYKKFRKNARVLAYMENILYLCTQIAELCAKQ